MNLTIITVLKTGRHLTLSRTLPEIGLQHYTAGERRETSKRPSTPGSAEVIADNITLHHMLERRREHDVEKFIVVRGTLVMELDPDGMPLSPRAA